MKERRIILRKRLSAAQAAKEADKEKRARRNREKQLKRRQKNREKKLQRESSKNQAQDLSKVNISSASKVALEVVTPITSDQTGSQDADSLSPSSSLENNHISHSSSQENSSLPVIRKIPYNQKVEQDIIQDIGKFFWGQTCGDL